MKPQNIGFEVGAKIRYIGPDYISSALIIPNGITAEIKEIDGSMLLIEFEKSIIKEGMLLNVVQYPSGGFTAPVDIERWLVLDSLYSGSFPTFAGGTNYVLLDGPCTYSILGEEI
jgi:hypothetical protein